MLKDLCNKKYNYKGSQTSKNIFMRVVRTITHEMKLVLYKCLHEIKMFSLNDLMRANVLVQFSQEIKMFARNDLMRSNSLEIKCCSGKIAIAMYTLNVFHPSIFY